jgi:hypothetical protein
MPTYVPTPVWKGEEVFIIGGGTSLRDFDWTLLHDEKTIGCNNAFRLGPEVCDVCVFVDRKFILVANEPRKGFYDELEKFPNPIITNDTQLNNRKEKWINWMPRKPRGLHHNALGFNANCAASAINLALLYGATTIYLLGIDMHLDSKGKPNWHNHLIDKPNPTVYERMITAYVDVKKDLREKFPQCKIFNVTKDSALNAFPKIDSDVFWNERKKNGRSDKTSVGPDVRIRMDDSIAHPATDSSVEADTISRKVAG